MRLDYPERFDRFRGAVNSLYLKVGGLQEIKQMSYWRFVSVLHTADDAAHTADSTPTVQHGLYQSQKDMIQKSKELKE